MLKVDVTLDLISGSCVQNSLHGGTQQDKEIGKDLVDIVQKDDLVLRDMGYFVIAEFALIAGLSASWLSRVPVSVIIRDLSGSKIEKALRACQGDLWDGEISLGEKEKHRCRLIAVRASPEVVRQNLKEASERAASRGKSSPRPDLQGPAPKAHFYEAYVGLDHLPPNLEFADASDFSTRGA